METADMLILVTLLFSTSLVYILLYLFVCLPAPCCFSDLDTFPRAQILKDSLALAAFFMLLIAFIAHAEWPYDGWGVAFLWVGTLTDLLFFATAYFKERKLRLSSWKDLFGFLSMLTLVIIYETIDEEEHWRDWNHVFICFVVVAILADAFSVCTQQPYKIH